MASKQHNQPTDSTGSSFLSQFPPRITLGSSVLASALDLPPQPHISCSTYILATDPAAPSAIDQLDKIEQVRRRICQEYGSRPITDGLLPSVRITRNSLALYIFALGSGEVISAAESALKVLTFDGLNLVDSSRFPVAGLYPCSIACSSQVAPCPTCIRSWTKPSESKSLLATSQLSSACLLPRTSLRRLYSQFLQALRDRLIHDITNARLSNPGQTSSNEGSSVRLSDGFLINPLSSAPSSEWGTGWDHRSLQQTLVHCQLQLELVCSRVLIHPVLRPTCYLPLSTVLPLPVGTPITLLPQGVTAYYLTSYTGPVGGLTAQFDNALLGLGAGNWQRYDDAKTAGPSSRPAVPYVIIWLAVQNKQGEDKGIRAIWPTGLCVAFSPAVARTLPSLPYIPDLPTQLQASPPAVAAQPSALAINSKSALRAFTPSTSSIPSPATETHFPHGPQSRQGTPRPVEGSRDGTFVTPPRKRPSFNPYSPTSDTLRAFKTLTLVNRDIRRIAGEVSGYVDAVVKEREKERERLRREREGGSSRAAPSPSKVEDKTSSLEHGKPSPPAIVNARVSTPSALKIESPASEIVQTSGAGILASDVPMADDEVSSAVFLAHETIGGLLPAPEITSTGSHRPTVEPPASGIVEPAPTISSTPAEPATAESNIPFESFVTFENGWEQSTSGFLTLDMGIENYDYPMSMDANGDDGGMFGADGTFNPLTDDDFSFFDAPAARPVTSPSATTAGPTAPVGLSSNTINPSMHASGPGPPALNIAQGLPWMNQGVGEGFTPRSLDTPSSVPPPPELVPSTPTLTPPSHSVPLTPTVMLMDQLHLTHGRKGSTGSASTSMFDPIPFAEAHKLSDGKYAMGKFALPTPPDEEDRTHPIPIRHPFPRRPGTGWRTSYTAVTDPRVGIIRRLKRKRYRKDEDGVTIVRSPAWMHECEEWMSSPPHAEDVDVDEGPSASEDEDEEYSVDDQGAEPESRVHTPPPSYLPVGPSLLATHFCHTFLLPMSSALRPPGASLTNPTGLGAGPMSVPTPVSPAAVLGDASAKSRALEDAAQILIRELVENCVWEASWRAGALAAYTARKAPTEVWQIHVQYVKQLLCSVESLQTPLSLRSGLSDDASDLTASMEELDYPYLAVGKSDSIIQVLPSALRFWDKLGLMPRAGRKDLNAFVVYEGGDEEREQLFATWLDSLSAVYTAKGFGRHAVGHAPSCIRDGQVPIHFDSIRKTLSSFTASLPEPECAAVFYIVVPAHAINLNSQVLRRVLYAVRKAAKSSHGGARVFQLVPEPLVMGALDKPSMNYSGLELLASSLYDRLCIPSRRSMARSLIPHDDKKVYTLFEDPAFVLARPTQWKPKFVREAHASILDVLDRHMLLHVAYSTSACGKWLFTAVVDQPGSTHDLRAVLIPSDAGESFIISSVWDFVYNMAMKANVEWHIVITKYGFMSAAEFDAWSSHLESKMISGNVIPPLKVSLLVAEADSRWHLLSPDQIQKAKSPISPARAPKLAPGTGFCDISATTYLLQPGIHSTLAVPSANHLSCRSPCILDPEDEKTTDELGMRPVATMTLMRVPAGSDYSTISMLHLHVLGSIQTPNSNAAVTIDEEMLREVATNCHDLSVLSRERWKLDANPILPFHLAALEVMQLALDKGDPPPDQQ